MLFFVHGLGEHINRYERLFGEFNRHGIRVHGFDHRGHGRTYTMNCKSMKVGHLGEIATAVRDVEVLLRMDRGNGVPRFLVSLHPIKFVFIIALFRWVIVWGV